MKETQDRAARVKGGLTALIALLVALAPLAALAGTVSELIGTPVHERGGEAIGEVKDVLFDARNGAIVAFTVEYGRWLRVASYEAAIPPGEFVREGDHMVLKKAAPALRRAAQIGWADWPALRATYVMGREVRDRLRRDSGVMVDLEIDAEGLHITHAVVDLRDEWEERERLLRVPFSAMSFPREYGDYPTFSVRREQLHAGEWHQP